MREKRKREKGVRGERRRGRGRGEIRERVSIRSSRI